MKTLKILSPITIFVLLMLVFPSFATAINYQGDLLVDNTYDVSARTDFYTELMGQDISFTIHKVVDEIDDRNLNVKTEGYTTNLSRPEEWHAEKNKVGAITNFETQVLISNPSNPARTRYPGLTEKYDEIAKGSSQSIKMIHYSNTGYKGALFPCTAWTEIPDMTIGEIEFCTMVHLNASNAKLYFSLDNLLGKSKMVYGYFEVYSTGANKYRTNVSIFETGLQTGVLSDTPKTVYTTGENQFGWIKVNIFLDTWNDLYNITLRQYGFDWTPIDVPTSYVVRGNQHSSDLSARINTGARLSASHILDKLKFDLISDAVYATSKAWIDNVSCKIHDFPSVFADVIYDNATFRQDFPGQVNRWLNQTIITSYRSPQYPHPAVTSISYQDSYLNNYTRPWLLTGWELAPTWMYVLPYVVPTGNATLIRNTILDYINDPITNFEDRGTLKPSEISDYGREAEGPFNTMGFTLDTENSSSDGLKTYLRSSTSPYYALKIAYFTDLANMGLLEAFKMYIGDERNPAYSEYLTIITLITPGYSVILLFVALGIMSVVIARKVKRNAKMN